MSGGRKIKNFMAPAPRVPAKKKFSQVEIAAFDSHGWVCHYCGVTDGLTADHIIPKRSGGQDVVSNIVPACFSCNASKGGKSREDFIEWRSAELVAFHTMIAFGDCI